MPRDRVPSITDDEREFLLATLQERDELSQTRDRELADKLEQATRQMASAEARLETVGAELARRVEVDRDQELAIAKLDARYRALAESAGKSAGKSAGGWSGVLATVATILAYVVAAWLARELGVSVPRELPPPAPVGPPAGP